MHGGGGMSFALDVVIVNWNADGHLDRCLRSLVEANLKCKVIQTITIVDNASTDKSAAVISRFVRASEMITSIINSKNLGFATACNQGAASGRAQYLLFLNPDTVVNAPCFVELAGVLRERDGLSRGIVGVKNLRNDGTIWRSCSRFPSPWLYISEAIGLGKVFPGPYTSIAMKEWAHDASQMVDQVIGAFFVVNRPLFVSLGGFDERFFVYFEEVDFCLRAREVGVRPYFLESASVVHIGGRSSAQAGAKRLLYSWRSRTEFAKKHWTRTSILVVIATIIVIETPLRITFSLLPRSGYRFSEVCWAAWEYLSTLLTNNVKGSRI